MFELPKLDYSYSALEPHIDAITMEIHHTKHHQTYVDKLNEALKDYPHLQGKTIYEVLLEYDALPDEVKKAVRNHGGGHANHTFFWKILKPDNDTKPNGQLAVALDKTFGSYENFQKLFSQAATSLFGSGWTWLAKDPGDGIEIITTPNQDSPLLQRYQPILGLDVWEHAYYLKYQNKRVDYINAWWNIVNWEQAEKNYIQ